MSRIALAVVLLLPACSGGDADPDARPVASAEQSGTASAAPANRTPSPVAATSSPTTGAGRGLEGVQLDVVEAAQLSGLDPSGAVEALRFADSNGVNVVLLRDVGTELDPSLRADHVLVEPAEGARRGLREVRDSDEACDLDEGAEFVAAGEQGERDLVEVHDDDGDGLGEVHFAYRMTCAGGVDPWALKLLVLEDGDKHILRGMTGTTGEDPAPEPDPGQWPQGSYDRALAQFRELQSTFCAPEPGCTQ